MRGCFGFGGGSWSGIHDAFFFFSLEGQTEGQNGGGQRAVSVMVLFTSGSIRSLYRVLYSVRKSRVVVVVHL